MAYSTQRTWPITVVLAVASVPLLLMYAWLFIDTVTDTAPGSVFPNRFTLEHWRFLVDAPRTPDGIWPIALNTLLFALATSLAILFISSTAGYALSRLAMPYRRMFLAGMLILHAFPTITLIIATFLILNFLGLYNTLIGVILVKASLELPFGIWIMKGFYDTVPWEIEMAGIADGASRFRVWRELVLPMVGPGILALGVFSFLSGWSEFILPQVLAPDSRVMVLSVYLASLISDDSNFDFNLFKSVGLFYIFPVIILYLFFQKHLMNIYGGGSKG